MTMSHLQRSLDGRRVVIVGGTSGMGRAAGNAAAEAGADVIVAGRRPPGERSAPAALGARIAHEVVDVTNEASVRALFERVGAFDHLLITAAPKPGSGGAFLEQDVAGARQFMDAKFFGSWACARYAAPHLRAGGSITFLTGGAAVRPHAGSSMVSAAFAALETLCQALAVELAPLRVNTLRPGYTDSDMWSFLDDAARERLRAKVRTLMPVRRIGTTEDVGQAAVFLMTNPQMTGSILDITGGETLVDGL